MKKIIAFLLAAAVLASFAGCSKTPSGDETTAPAPETTAAQASLTGTLEEINDKIYEKTTKVEMMLAPAAEIEITNADSLKYYLGISSADSIERATFSEPMISSIAYSMCLVKVKEGADVEKLKSDILSGVDYRKWICVAAEKLVAASCGDVVMFVMGSEEIADDVYNAFNEVCGGAASAAMTQQGELVDDGGSIEDQMPAV